MKESNMDVKNLLFLPLLLNPTFTLAFFCPTNFVQIDYGNTPAQVMLQCGKPDKVETKDVKKQVPEEWSYFVPQTVAASTMFAAQGTLKTQITFDSGGKVLNL